MGTLVAKKQPVKQPKTTEEKTEAVKDTALTTVVEAFDKSWEYTSSSWHDRWQNNYKLYNNERVKRGYDGITDTFVPMTFGTVETLTSALFGTKPKFGYLPPAAKANQSTDILNGLLDHFWELDQWSMKVINTGRGMIREGTSVDYYCWDTDHPRLINVAIRDFFIAPEAFELDERSTRYCGRRFLSTVEELESYEVIDLDAMEESPESEPIFKKKYDLAKYKAASTSSTKTEKKGSGVNQEQTTDKQEKDMFYGSTMTGDDSGQVEVIEYWTVDKTISVLNRKFVIEDTENIYKAKDRANGSEYPKGILPFAPCRNYVDGSLFYAKSDIDFIADQQELLNDVTNQTTDAVTFNLNQMYTLDPKYAHLLKEIENLPGAVYPVPKDTLNPVAHGQIPAEAFGVSNTLKGDIRETTASNEVVKGAAQQGGKTTATEINAQVAGAGQRINLKVTQIENEYFHRMAKIIFKLIQLYITEPQMVRILGKDGARWEEFDPNEFKGEYEPRIQLDISIQNKKQEQAAQAKEMLAAFLNDPNVNQQELSKLVLARSFDLDPDEVEALMNVPPQMGAPGMPGMEGMPTDPSMMGADPNAGMMPEGGMPPPPPETPAAPPEAGQLPDDVIEVDGELIPLEDLVQHL